MHKILHFRAQLLAAKQTVEARIVHHTALYVINSSCAQGSSVSSGQGILRTPSQPLPHVQSFGGQLTGPAPEFPRRPERTPSLFRHHPDAGPTY